MAGVSNFDRVGKALETLRLGLGAYVAQELAKHYGNSWRETLLQYSSNAVETAKAIAANEPLDVQLLLKCMSKEWRDVFRPTLGWGAKNLVDELWTFRTDWAHQKQFSADDAYRCMDSGERLLTAISAPQAEVLNNDKMLVMREKFQQQMRDQRKKGYDPNLIGQPAANLKSWREIVTPHPDVSSGNFQQAEFAADLHQVYRGKAKAEYGDPKQFFRRTYMTEGLKTLLRNAITRVCSGGGDPIVELQTNFGGGKTHSMLALYHLFSGAPFAELAGVEELSKDLGIADKARKAQRAVLVGTRLQPGQPSTKDDGTVIHTIWGELAWQLGGKKGYEMLRQADETATGPGEALQTLIEAHTPCVILIDEWVAYARQLDDDGRLCGGSFETQFTFAQTLTETVKAVPGALLLVSIPASDISDVVVSPHYQDHYRDVEIGGERGVRALHRLKNVIGRTESAWRPASQEESYHIVRRRLFNEIEDADLFKERDAVIDAFFSMYGNQAKEFPAECREQDYRRRMHACYPIHPEMFDRLYNEWSTLERFQRTRGVLRLMASVIHALWDRQDASLLIMPASIPVDDPAVQNELTQYLSASWIPVIERDVDGRDALSRKLDHEVQNLGRYSACRRVSRSIFMASAPMEGSRHRGIDDRQVRLACVMPGENAATFGDALRRYADQAMHLYVDSNRYWFDLKPTVQRLAKDRAKAMKADTVVVQIEQAVSRECRQTGAFAAVHACPQASSDVLDERRARLVVFGPSHTHERNNDDSSAMKMARDLLENRGNAPRQYRNTLIFLAPEQSQMQALDEAMRMQMAWHSIDTDVKNERITLDPGQKQQVADQLSASGNAVLQRLHDTYCWMLVPGKITAQDREITWDAKRVRNTEGIVEGVSKAAIKASKLFDNFGAVALKVEIDTIPLWEPEQPHVAVKDLVDHFARYPYLPRLQSEETLLNGIREGVALLTWHNDAFAYADGYDEEQQRYQALQVGQTVFPTADGPGLLVKAEVALAQIQRETAPPVDVGGGGDTGDDDTVIPPIGPQPGVTPPLPPDPPPSTGPRRFYGTVEVDPSRMSSQSGALADEIIQHLGKQLRGSVKVTVEIEATCPDGFPEDVVRIVNQNSRDLKFTQSGFEDA